MPKNEHGKDRQAERALQAETVRKIVVICVTVLMVALVLSILIGYLYLSNALEPIAEEGEGEEVEVSIPVGSSAQDIGQVLEEEGLITNATIFRYYTRYKNESGFQAGDYTLSTEMAVDDILVELKDGSMEPDVALSITIPEGLWLTDMAALIEENTDHTAEEVIELLDSEEYVESLIDRYSMLSEVVLDEEITHPLEGYLFPARYDFAEEDPSIEEIVEAMLDRMQSVVDTHGEEIESSDYSLHQILTLASIIEREAQTSEDRFTISGVLHNRMDERMPLQVDPTIAYAHGEHIYMTTYDQLEIESPYNTYRNTGLPPGPISSMREESIEAAVTPNDTDDKYFYARYNGEVIYNETYEEHDATRQEYRHEWEEAAED
ncbi:endolytic transglycosylase MltG [Shouchella shacheensis]|uniref:endolytic transglycosylase MltG n=1 Tax=Shouchella shacheensis TaxID=1649580 RepID=UPI00073FE098|nr:endolytic transglycosylase MltG [Shouchella shacheensis]